jgi:neutral ceramidase
MKEVGIIMSKIIFGLIMISFINSCSVVKTPYFKTAYYQKTVSRLDSLKSGISSSEDSVYAGFARVSITPSLNNIVENPANGQFDKVPLGGFGKRRGKPATGVHDSIFVKAVALRSGKKTMVLVSADILIMPPNIIDTVTFILSKEGLQRNQLFFSATHTHSGIGGWGYGFMAKVFAGKENPGLEKWLVNQIKKAVLDAVSDLHPARVGSGSFNASAYTRNRLTGNPMQKNNDFNFLVLEQTGRKKAIIGSFSAHATTLESDNMLLTADYPGYWERKIENNNADLAMFCSGSVANQSPVGEGSNFDSAKNIGEALADSLSAHLKEVKMNGKLIISTLSLRILLPEYHIRLSTNRNLTTGLSKRLMPLPKNVYLQALRINNLIWFFTPGDFSGESAVLIKKLMASNGYEAMVSSFNGSYVGYLLPGKYFYLDNYESKIMGWFGPTMGDYTNDLIEQMGDAIILQKVN